MKFFLEHYDGVLLMLGAGGITILAKTIVAWYIIFLQLRING